MAPLTSASTLHAKPIEPITEGVDEPTRPDEKATREESRIIRERLATYEEDRKPAKPRPEIKAEILRQLKQPAPR
jgi:hypothetical protein